MSAFNTITASSSCPNCGRNAEFEVQFKYGDTRQHSYNIGEKLRWGGNDVGTPGKKQVLIEGIGGPCPHCKVDNLDFDVVVKEDRVLRIESVRSPRSSSGPEGFVVVEH